jgi:hypothetical protein
MSTNRRKQMEKEKVAKDTEESVQMLTEIRLTEVERLEYENLHLKRAIAMNTVNQIQAKMADLEKRIGETHGVSIKGWQVDLETGAITNPSPTSVAPVEIEA